MPSQLSGASTSPEKRGSRLSWLLPAGTFLAGCALGAVVMGVGDLDAEDEPPAQAVSEATDEGTGTQSDGADGGGDARADESGLYVRVPDSCVQTAEDATALVEQVDRVVAAVAELEPERLRQTVDDVQQLRDGVEDVAEQCRTAAAQRLQDAADLEGEGQDEDAAPATPAS